MFLPSSSPLGVKPTEDDAENCSNFIDNINKGKNLFTAGHFSFEEKGIQYYYENFRIESVTSSSVAFIILLAMFSFVHGLVVSLTFYEGVWLMRAAMVIRNINCIVALYIAYKIFRLRVRPESSTREEFHRYVSSVVRLSNFVVISFALVNGFVYAWKSSLGSCLIIENNQVTVNNDNYYFMNCNPSYEVGSTPTEAMLTVLVGNILIIATLRSHSYWAAWVSYVVTLLSVITAAVVSPLPRQSGPVIIFALLLIPIYVSMEHSTVMMFTALLELSTMSRVKTTELKQFVGNVAHDLKVCMPK